ncbi:hypothetical protein [Aquimarina sp. LLG6339-5]|uniref:hypothetical protein n=1 Tax=Aquimarina sp. LLG6339-5 TaxID=3160830 RepID=UPI00386C185D
MILVLVAGTRVSAQQKMTITEMANYQTETMINELALDEKQTEKVASINLKYSAKMVVLMEAEGSMFGKMGDMKKIKQNKSDELKMVFTPEQFEKYEDDVAPSIRKHMRKNMKM